MKCPHCQHEINIGALLATVKSDAKSEAARKNGALGGRPKGKAKKRKPRKDANQIAHGVVAAAEKLTRQIPPSSPALRVVR